MALPQEAIAIDVKRKEIVAQIDSLKAQAKDLKQQFDAIVNKANLEHRFARLTDAEKQVLKDML